MGSGEWGVGSGEWGLCSSVRISFILCPLPSALCSLHNLC